MNKAVELAEMISANEEAIQALRVSQGYLVAQVAREELYLEHPDPQAQAGLREYLKYACNLGVSSVSELYAFGGIVVPFCEKHRIGLKVAASAKNWPKLREALPALRRAIEGSDVRAVKAILKDVRQAPTRLWIRNKYRNQRAAIGRGFTVEAGNGDLILVARMNKGVTKETLIGRLGNLLELIDPPEEVLIDLPVAAALPPTT
jgi:hypothetical protein